MPTYDYRCLNCNRRFDIFLTYQEYETTKVHCPHCQSDRVQRRIGRIRVARSEENFIDDLSDPSKMADLEDDPKAMGRFKRRMSHGAGEEMGPEFNELVSRLESGQSPEEIEQAMPQLADEIGGKSSLDDGPNLEDDDF